jgi:hypothetical protein
MLVPIKEGRLNHLECCNLITCPKSSIIIAANIAKLPASLNATLATRSNTRGECNMPK